MRRILGLENLGAPIERSAVTIGKFFALHRGHQALLQATVAAARAEDAQSVVLTFDRHPAEILRPGTRFPELASLDERLARIEAAGIDVTVVAQITPAFLAQEPEAFVRDVLVGQLGAVEVIAGANFRFGKGARGDGLLLDGMGEELGFRFARMQPVLEDGERISSSRVARCIEAGQTAAAMRLLGRPYDVPGVVIPGEQLGRQLGYPTANVQTPPERLLPADGIYVVTLQPANGDALPGVASLGVRPTLGGRPRLLEVHVLDWQGDLYGQSVSVAFLERLRGEENFPSLEALKQQIDCDADRAREHFRAKALESR